MVLPLVYLVQSPWGNLAGLLLLILSMVTPSLSVHPLDLGLFLVCKD